MDNMGLETIYGAPHYGSFKSYKYEKGCFVKSGEYLISVSGPIDAELLDIVLSLENKKATSYRDIRKDYGQINLVENIDNIIPSYCLMDFY